MRLIVLKAAKAMDLLGNREARVWVSMAKAMVPERVCRIIDQAIQIHVATGISHWTPLADLYADVRHLRFADGPDAVHYRTEEHTPELQPLMRLSYAVCCLKKKQQLTSPQPH